MTQRELARAAGFGSHQGVQYHLGRLEEEGLVQVGEAPSRKVRPVSLTRKGWEAVGETPMLGSIAAGRGIEAVVEDDTYSLFGELLATRSGRARFVLRARGDSMLGAHIADGDLLLVEEDESPPDGTVVAALLPDDTVTVKRLYREGEMVRLRPENTAYQDLLHPAEQVVVQGRVEMVLHPPRR